ncbi:MAG: hypothetical protein U1A78_15265 [Polyangia bacterium]
MLPFPEDRDTPEIRLMRTIVDLNYRILRTQSPDDRTALRTTITVLRSELVKLIEAIPIFSEEDARRASTAQGMALIPTLAGGAS